MKSKQLRYVPTFSLFFLMCFFSATASLSAQAEGIQLTAKVFLKGALIGTNKTHPIMRDDIRAYAFLPTTEPYAAFAAYTHRGQDGGGETVTDLAVFETTGNDAIVDWVFIELRNRDNPADVVATRSALVQRDGDVVDVDGVSGVRFKNISAGEYYVAIRHRNHLGVMTAELVGLGKTSQLIDFTDPTFAVYGTNARVSFGEKMAMQAGDLNQDRKCVYQGPGNDVFNLFFHILSSDNVEHAHNHILFGYHLTDLNMDGAAIFTGPNSDHSHYFIHVIGQDFQGLNHVNFEQLPK